MSEAYPIALTFDPPADEVGGEPTTVTIDITQPGLSILASGDTTETTYDFTAPTLTIALGSIEGVAAEAIDTTATATLTNVTGKYLFAAGAAEGAVSDLTSSFAADTLTLAISGSDPDPSPSEGEAAAGPSTVKFNMTVADITGTTNGTLLSAAAMADMAAALQAGFATEGTINAGATTYDMEVTDPTGLTKINGTGASTSLGFAMDASRLSYSVGSKGLMDRPRQNAGTIPAQGQGSWVPWFTPCKGEGLQKANASYLLCISRARRSACKAMDSFSICLSACDKGMTPT